MRVSRIQLIASLPRLWHFLLRDVAYQSSKSRLELPAPLEGRRISHIRAQIESWPIRSNAFVPPGHMGQCSSEKGPKSSHCCSSRRSLSLVLILGELPPQGAPARRGSPLNAPS